MLNDCISIHYKNKKKSDNIPKPRHIKCCKTCAFYYNDLECIYKKECLDEEKPYSYWTQRLY